MYKLFFLVTIFSDIFFDKLMVNGGTESEMRQLLFAKLNSSDYSPRVRPIKDTGKALNLYVDMYLVSINKIEEVSQKITTTAYMKLVWSDTFMTWAPTDYGNITQFSLPQNEIWKPDVALANAYNTISGLGAPFMYVVVTNDGNITWEPFQVFESTCRLDMTNFPFDKHICDLEMATWSSTRDMIHIIPGTDGFNINAFEENANWYLDSVSTFDSSSSLTSSLSFSLTIRRKPVYYILNVMIPIILLSVLNNFVFVLPCGSGEKLSYAIILFLSFAIFLLIVTETMPEGMTTTPVVTLYLLIECVFSTFIVLITTVQLRLHNHGDKTPLPKVLQKFTKTMQHITSKVSCQSQKATNKNDTEDDKVIPMKPITNKSHSVKPKIIEEKHKQTNEVPTDSASDKCFRPKFCFGTNDTDNASDDIDRDTWNGYYKRSSEKTDFRLAHILGSSNRVEPAAFFNKPSQVYPMYDKNLAMDDVEDKNLAMDDIEDLDKMLPGQPTKLENVYNDLPECSTWNESRKLDSKESTVSGSETASVKSDTEEKEVITWPEFVLALDSVFFILSLIINTIATVVAFAVSHAG